MAQKCGKVDKFLENEVINLEKSKIWHLHSAVSKDLYIFVSAKNFKIKYAPLFIFSLPLLKTRTLNETLKYNLNYKDENLPTKVNEKLRYYRYKKGFTQAEIAKIIGIDRTSYIKYESEEREKYDKKVMMKLSKVFEVSIEEFGF